VTRRIFAANWKMHLAPDEARAYIKTLLDRYPPPAAPDRELWFFPPAVSLEATARAVAGRPDLLAGAQDIYWEPKGAFTGAVSAPMVKAAGARAVLVGHSERRHVFGESDADTRRKVRAGLDAGLRVVLCVGEKLNEREAGQATAVVTRQLQAALGDLDAATLDTITIAYEPVWAIGTGHNATPRDAAEMHRQIRAWLTAHHARNTVVLYGGSVNARNAAELLAEPELDGVLVGGASLDPVGWATLVQGIAA
jgi:triosephosphate isomerase